MGRPDTNARKSSLNDTPSRLASPTQVCEDHPHAEIAFLHASGSASNTGISADVTTTALAQEQNPTLTVAQQLHSDSTSVGRTRALLHTLQKSVKKTFEQKLL